MSPDLLFGEQTEQIIAACFEVHNTLGTGFVEVVYQEALKVEFQNRNIPFEKEKKLNVSYKGLLLDKFYCADFVCFDNIILELKAIDHLSPEHVGQVLNYLRATHLKLGMLINFGSTKLQIKRVVY